MPKSEQSLNELLYDLKRIEEHREILSENKIRKIYKSLMKELNAFIAEEYFLYADGEGVLSYATLQEKARKARFLEEVVRQVDSITPELKAEMMKLVEETYTNCYQGMQNAVINASNTQELAAVMSDTTLRPEVLKQAVNNNISKLTLPNVLEKHRQEIVYNIKQELTIGMINGDRYEQMARRITDKVDISYKKAVNVARTESHRNIESGLYDCAENIAQSLEGSGLVAVATWRTMKDERVRPNIRRKTKKGWKTYKSTNGADHQKMEGVTVRVGDFFEFSDGVKTKHPSKSGVAHHDCNCRCVLEYDYMTEEEFAKLNSNSKLTGKITITTEKAVANPNESGIIDPEQKPVILSLSRLEEFEEWQKSYYKANRGVPFTRADNPTINHYSGGAYEAINAIERGGVSLERAKRRFGEKYLESCANYGDELSKELSKFALHTSINVKRSVGDVDFITGATSSIEDMKKMVGKTFTEKGFTSTTVCADAQLPFGGMKETRTALDIEVPKGTKGAYIYKISDHPAEFEFLIDRNTTYEIVDAGVREVTIKNYKGEIRKEKERFMKMKVIKQ